MSRFSNAFLLLASVLSLQAMAADPAPSADRTEESQAKAATNDAQSTTPAKKKKPKKPMNDLVNAFRAEVSQYQVKRKP